MIKRFQLLNYLQISTFKKRGINQFIYHTQQFCNKKNKANEQEQLEDAEIMNQEKISITKQEILKMHQFMTDPSLSAPQLSKYLNNNLNTQATSDIEGYFKNEEQLVSLAILKLNHKSQFVHYFQKYAPTESFFSDQIITIRLLILYQYWKTDGFISYSKQIQTSSNDKKVQRLAFNFLKDLLIKENMQKLNEKELQQLLIIYQDFRANNLPNHICLLPKNPPLLPNYSHHSTSLIKKLAQAYQNNIVALTQILGYYKENTSSQEYNQNNPVCNYSCWQMLHVYIIAYKLYSLSTSKQLTIQIQGHIKLIGMQIIQQFSKSIQDKSALKSEQNQGSAVKYSSLSFIQLLIKNLTLLEQSQFDSLYQNIFQKQLFDSNFLKQSSLSILVPLLYTTVINYEEAISLNKNQAIRQLSKIFLIFLSKSQEKLKQSKQVSFSNYAMLWNTTMVINKTKLLPQNQLLSLFQYLISLSSDVSINENLCKAPQYAEEYSEKQNILFNMLITYRLIISPQRQYLQFPVIRKEIQDRRVLLIKLLLQIRKIYEVYHHSNNINEQLMNNIVITTMIAQAYSKKRDEQSSQNIKAIQIFLSSPIKQALQSQLGGKHSSYIKALLEKY